MKCNLSVLCLMVFFLAIPLLLNAQSATDIVKELNTELRNAQSAYFNQKFEKSLEGVEKSSALIENLKKIDAQHKQLKSFEQRLGKLKSDLDKKLKKSEAGGIVSKAPANSRPAQAFGKTDISKTARLPRKTAAELRELSKTMDSLERFEKGRMDRLAQGENPERVESILGEISAKAESIDGLLAKLTAAAQEEGALEHPEYLEIKERSAMVKAWATQQIKDTREKVAKLQAGQAAATEAADNLKKLWEEYDDKFFTKINNLSYENSMEKLGEAFNLIAEFNLQKSALLSTIEDFEKKFGNTREAIEEATGGMDAVYPWENFKQALQNLDKTPARMAENMKSMLEGEISSLPSRHDFYRIDRHNEIKKMVEFCRKNVADFTQAAEIAAKLETDLNKFHEKIAAHEWPANKGSSSDQAAALEYLSNSWGKDQKHNYKVLGTVVRGDWSVQKKDLLGQPIMYGLPVLLAVQKPEDKEHGLARVFVLTLRTAEAAGIKMAPPFTSDTVGDSHFIKAEKIK